jgi:hypothetical protein
MGAWDLLWLLSDTDPWFNESWLIRIRLAFDNSMQQEDLLDFPVLVVLNPTRISYSDVAADGSDMRFTDGGRGEVLFYEIDEWNPGDTSFLWVRVPRIDGGSDSDRIRLYYDNVGTIPTSGVISGAREFDGATTYITG